MNQHYAELVKEMNLTTDQRHKFKALCDQVETGGLTMNQAYKRARSEEYMGAGGTFKEDFQAWIDTAKENQWVSQALGIAYNASLQENNWGSQVFTFDPNKKTPTETKSNKGVWIAVAIGVVAVGMIVYFNQKNKN